MKLKPTQLIKKINLNMLKNKKIKNLLNLNRTIRLQIYNKKA